MFFRAAHAGLRGAAPKLIERKLSYSTQILNHLIAEAEDRCATSPLLGLFVHPDNQRAIRVYERGGFVPFSHTYTDKATGVSYRSMLYQLPSHGPHA